MPAGRARVWGRWARLGPSVKHYLLPLLHERPERDRWGQPREDGKTATRWRNTSAIATGAFAAATGAALLYFLRTRNDTKTNATRRVELGFSLTPRSTALSATGSF